MWALSKSSGTSKSEPYKISDKSLGFSEIDLEIEDTDNVIMSS
jgi:hypothetical protein